MNNLSIRHVRAFVEVSRCGSFTRAATSLHQTQSALTATIKQLEQQAGLVLLDRTTRRVLLTSEGERFMPVAERLLSDFDTALKDLQSTAEKQRGQIDIAAAPSVLTRLMPLWISGYRQRYPRISIGLRDDSAGAIEQRVLDNRVDFGIASNHSRHPDLDYQPLLRDRYGAVTPSAPGKRMLDWERLGEAGIIHLSTDTGIRAQLSAFEKQGLLKLPHQDALIEVSNPAALAVLVEQGLGVSVLPALAAATPAFDRLYFTPLTAPLIEREIAIITRRGRALTPAAEAMAALITESIGEMALPPFVTLVSVGAGTG